MRRRLKQGWRGVIGGWRFDNVAWTIALGYVGYYHNRVKSAGEARGGE